MKVKAVFERLIYHNDVNNFAIFATTNGTVCKGTILHDPEELLNVDLVLEGEMVSHPKFGRQFEFKNYSLKISSMEFFLKKLVKTIPQSTIDEIVKKYLPSEFKKIIYENPKKLLEIKGIGEKKLARIVENFKKYEHLMELTELLAPYGISNHIINLIYEEYKNEAMKILNENPYELTKIKGIGFLKADEVALKLGKKLNDKNRLKEGIKYIVKQTISEEKHTVIEKEELINKSIELLKDKNGIYSPSKEEIDFLISELVNNQELVEIDKYITFPVFKAMEEYIFNLTQNVPLNWSIPYSKEELKEIIEKYEKNNFPLGEKQKEAIINFATTSDGIFILGGYAGSGKTTTSKLILDIYANVIGKENIVACALSGNASNRIKNVTGYKAFTIHSLLGYTKDGFEFNENNPLPYKLIVLDEASMVDISLFYNLLKAIDFKKTKLFLIGDNAQLPPVGAGEVFEDLLNYSNIKKIILDKVYRQNEKQVINVFAQEIRKGNVPKGYKSSYEDYEFKVIEIDNYFSTKNTLPQKDFQELKNETYLKILKEILEEAKNKKEDIFKFLYDYKPLDFISEFQVICPIKKGVIGTENLNKELKNVLNPLIPGDKHIKIGDKIFSMFDKVIHLQNTNKPVIPLYERKNVANIEEYYLEIEKKEEKVKRVFNGQVGIISNIFEVIRDIDEFGEMEFETVVEVYYPYEEYCTYYKTDEFSTGIIDLAYAITIHKSQGSEYKNVVMPMSYAYYMMLNNKLLYTGITRAKRKLTVIGESYAFYTACKKKDETVRKTVYKIFLSDEEKIIK